MIVLSMTGCFCYNFAWFGLNSKYEDIELKKGVKYRVVGKVVKKEKRY